MSVSHSTSSVTSQQYCSCGAPHSGTLVPVTRFAYQRRVRRSFLFYAPEPGIRVYSLPCHCSLWVYRTGQRFISTLPF